MKKSQGAWQALPPDVAEWMGMWEPVEQTAAPAVPAQRSWRERLHLPVHRPTAGHPA